MSNDDALIVCKRSSSLLPAAMLAAYERHRGAIGTDAEADKLILQYGRPFTGIKRPKGYRDRAQKKCFLNAVNLTTAKRGTYCEGFAASVGSSFIFHHAWITLDGEHAIDVTLSDAEDHFYFGIAFSSPQFNEVLRQRMENGKLRPFISFPIDDLLRRHSIPTALAGRRQGALRGAPANGNRYTLDPLDRPQACLHGFFPHDRAKARDS